MRCRLGEAEEKAGLDDCVQIMSIEGESTQMKQREERTYLVGNSHHHLVVGRNQRLQRLQRQFDLSLQEGRIFRHPYLDLESQKEKRGRKRGSKIVREASTNT